MAEIKDQRAKKGKYSVDFLCPVCGYSEIVECDCIIIDSGLMKSNVCGLQEHHRVQLISDGPSGKFKCQNPACGHVFKEEGNDERTS